ncbi:MAG: hypothetical protein QM770_13370 [Tepidisphaeraceae bacterium]
MRNWSLYPEPVKQVEARRAFAQKLKDLPKPIYINDEIYSLPWHSSDSRFPAFVVLDPAAYEPAQRRGVLAKDFMKTLVGNGEVRTLIIRQNDPFYAQVVEAGCIVVENDIGLPGLVLTHEPEPKAPLVLLAAPSAASKQPTTSPTSRPNTGE